MKKSEMQEAARILQDSRSFLVVGHISPDGDSIGCLCALGLSLQGLGKSVLLISPDGVPEVYRFLPGSERVLKEVPPNQHFDIGLIVDCENSGRLGSAAEAMKSCRKTVEIDHHPGGERSSDVQLVDSSAASCGEIVFELLLKAGVETSPDVAECLLTAIITDTGCFRFSSVKPSTLRTAADLLERGASISKIIRKVYETRPLSSAKLLGAALSTLETAAHGRIAYASITREQMASAQAGDTEGEGIVNYIRSVRGAQVGILFREEADGTTRVSLRSGDRLDISQVARLFGGGGHRTAAGCTLDRPLTEAMDLVLGAVQKWMAF